MTAALASSRHPAVIAGTSAPPCPGAWRTIAVLAALTGVARVALELVPVVPPPLVALMVGMVAGNLPAARRMAGGRELPYELPLLVGVVLIGAQFDAGVLAVLQPPRLLPVAVVVAGTVVAFTLLARSGIVPRRLARLAALGLAGFGVSAVTAAAVHDRRSAGAAAAWAVGLVLLTGALALVTLPLVGHALGLSPDASGVWSGAAVANTAEAVATASAASPDAMRTAAALKLLVNALQGIAIVVFLATTPQAARSGSPTRLVSSIPPFVLGFIGVATLALLGAFTPADRQSLQAATDWLFLIALAGIGFRTRPDGLLAPGLRPLIAALLAWVAIAGLALLAVQATCC